jgi:hypothetical protein
MRVEDPNGTGRIRVPAAFRRKWTLSESSGRESLLRGGRASGNDGAERVIFNIDVSKKRKKTTFLPLQCRDCRLRLQPGKMRGRTEGGMSIIGLFLRPHLLEG